MNDLFNNNIIIFPVHIIQTEMQAVIPKTDADHQKLRKEN